MNEPLTRSQMRNVFETLCEGDMQAAMPLAFMRQFKESLHMYFWLQRNGVRGSKLVELFEENGNLGAVNYILDRISGRKFTSEKIIKEDLI